MNNAFARVLCVAALAAALASPAFALELPEIKKQFPESGFIVGIGEMKASGNGPADKRMAEVLARLEIAKQIRVRVEEEMVDTACEGSGKTAGSACRNEVVMIIKLTVDEVLAGSKIVKSGEEKGTVYAVAVIPKGDSGGLSEKKAAEMADLARENLKKAEAGDGVALKTAKQKYLMALGFLKEAETMGKKPQSGLLDDIGKDIKRLEAAGQ